MSEKTIIVFSSLKIVASLMVFIHHYLKTIGAINYYSYSVILAIAVFLFISGYLINTSRSFSTGWLTRKIVNILAPYILIMIPLIIVNLILKSKTIDLKSIVFELVGLTIFVEKPFYEAMWFVSLILGLYLCVYVSSLIAKDYIFAMPLALAFLYFVVSSCQHIYFLKREYLVFWLVIYFSGSFIGRLKGKEKNVSIFTTERPYSFSFILMLISKHSFYFYLIHGPVLFLLYNIFRLGEEFTFLLGLMISSMTSLLLSNITKMFLNKLSLTSPNAQQA